ncbi:acyl-CoA dehydrogenase [[Pantoea] beijingensis]|uniref:Acyl-CoA dehydrogenase n=1 Tax=[Pantoea] beijingensis TaxID=1324864 RepID=A0A443IHP2_9GAMM|nr:MULTISPECIES: acyl-CoA dehydrogenase family protein [Erwiniaceae]RWR03618.1 acyl-CoA dehydrogenase [[Pantoea] beijingensis]
MPDTALRHWLDERANSLDQTALDAAALLPRLADSGLFRIGVPENVGGSGGTINDAVVALSEVASHSMTAAFVFWGHRAFIELLLQSANTELRDALLPRLLGGELAGASGLSNAMKFLSGIESLQINADADADDVYRLNGQMHWVTNLRPDNFVVATAVHDNVSHRPFIAVLPSDRAGLTRSDDLDLMALQGSYTAAIKLQNVKVTSRDILHNTAPAFLAQGRPAFLGLQCGMALGVTSRSLEQTKNHLGRQNILHDEWQTLHDSHQLQRSQLLAGLTSGEFLQNPKALFRIRINMVDTASKALQLELLASGGKAYLTETGSQFARRWRESAFLPIVTPGIVQLRLQLARENA